MGRPDKELLDRRNQLLADAEARRSQLAASGKDFAERREVLLSFSGPIEDTARRLAAAMVKQGMGTPVIVAPDLSSLGQPWKVRTSILGSIDFVTKRETLVTFLLFADNYDCDFEGWDATE